MTKSVVDFIREPEECYYCQTQTFDPYHPLMFFLMTVSYCINPSVEPCGLVFRKIIPSSSSSKTGTAKRGKMRQKAKILAIIPTAWSETRSVYRVNASSIRPALTYDFFKSEESLILDKATSIANAHLGCMLYKNRGPPLPDAHPKIHEKYAASMIHINRGVEFESVAKEKFEQVSGHRLIPLNPQTIFTRTNMFDGKLAATPDGITYCGQIFEAKCPAKLGSEKVRQYNEQLQSMMHTLMIDQSILFQYHVPTKQYMSIRVKMDRSWDIINAERVRDHIAQIDHMVPVFTHPVSNILNGYDIQVTMPKN
jgi:hypothetical protein